jgi:tRNA(fMet)-specific endonuclease VapC
VVLGELLAGFEIGRRRQQNRAELQEFQQSARVRLAEITEETAERYARIYAYQRGIGRPIPTNDLWIAAQRSAPHSRFPLFSYAADNGLAYSEFGMR